MGYRKTITVEFEGGGKSFKKLRRAGAKIELGLGTVTREVTSRAVSGARSTGTRLGGVHRHVLPGVVAQGNNVKLDARSQPAILGAEFGGARRPTTQQFPPWRGANRDAGYMLYPSLRRQEREIDRIVAALIDKAL